MYVLYVPTRVSDTARQVAMYIPLERTYMKVKQYTRYTVCTYLLMLYLFPILANPLSICDVVLS